MRARRRTDNSASAADYPQAGPRTQKQGRYRSRTASSRVPFLGPKTITRHEPSVGSGRACPAPGVIVAHGLCPGPACVVGRLRFLLWRDPHRCRTNRVHAAARRTAHKPPQQGCRLRIRRLRELLADVYPSAERQSFDGLALVDAVDAVAECAGLTVAEAQRDVAHFGYRECGDIAGRRGRVGRA